MSKLMKKFNRKVRLSVTALAIAALMLTGFSARSLAQPMGKSLNVVNTDKHVQITVEIHGDIDGVSDESIEAVIAEWLEAAHFIVSENDATDALHLHVKLAVTDNHHFMVDSDCSDWHEEKEAAVANAINDILHHMVNDFINKYSH
jgi:hypothetical protein